MKISMGDKKSVEEIGTGLSTANSYVTVAEATAYYVNILNGSAWATATDTDKEATLIMATRLLDEKVAWKGIKKTKEQSLPCSQEM